MPELAGKVALITGASSGIGAATAKALTREGVRVALLARRKDRLRAVAEEIRRHGGGALVCAADMADAIAVQAVVERVLGEWRGIDLLVNNCGRGLAAPFENTTAKEFRSLLEVNLVSVLTATQAAARNAEVRVRPCDQCELGGGTPRSALQVSLQRDQVRSGGAHGVPEAGA